jgi:hypothetical protein
VGALEGVALNERDKDTLEVGISGQAARDFLFRFHKEKEMSLMIYYDDMKYEGKVVDVFEIDSENVSVKLQLRFRPEDVIKKGLHNLVPDIGGENL